MRKFLLVSLLVLVCVGIGYFRAESAEPSAEVSISELPSHVTKEVILTLALPDEARFQKALAILDENWNDGLTVPIIELFRYIPRGRLNRILSKLEKWTGRKHVSVNDWYSWYWAQSERPPDWYPDFKGIVYSQIDPSFRTYFKGRRGSDIDLTEVRWGGVPRDGIPPLDHPEMLTAEKAGYLNDSDVIFGIVNNGDARAYPKRILAWHEMFRDEIGGESIAGVYCTLCGTVIPYKSQKFVIGTSGFLYRSNKLMYDLKTRSLWSTLEGRPVFGPLRDQNIQLKSIPVVTTTWGEWKKQFPETTVLSLNTGHKRDYGEGVAYRDYFATDELMFIVQATDDRLKNKDEVLVPRLPGPPTSIAQDFLRKHPIYHHRLGEIDLVVLTDKSGANRVYDSGQVKFRSYENNVVIDEQGKKWRVKPHALIDKNGTELTRLPAHRAFWFGWYSAHPDTTLIQ